VAWQLHDIKLKLYPHFDKQLSKEQALALVTNPAAVATHKFYPFIRFEEGWTKFAEKGGKGERKDRELRYAARADSYIYSYYRNLLSQKYEERLAAAGIGECVTAYRRIVDNSTGRGKSNIEHARDVFFEIKKLEECYVIALDITKFFESLDHEKLKTYWSEVIGLGKLPRDHYRVFKSVTSYSVVDKIQLYTALGYIGPKGVDRRGVPKVGYKVAVKDIPLQLCTSVDFRRKVAGKDGCRSLIRRNMKNYGIPQGSPMSDLLANMYMFNFDVEMDGIAKSRGGIYRRYSDDIIFIIKGSEVDARSVAAFVRDKISYYGKKMKIKESKSSIFFFRMAGGRQICELLDDEPGRQGRNGLEYLGFRFDGRKIYLRDKTISGLWRKVSLSARASARSFVKRYSDKTFAEISEEFNYDYMINRFGRIPEFWKFASEYKHWTFWTYARKAVTVFGVDGAPISRQIRYHRSFIRKKCEEELALAYKRHRR